jgi:hypothetical protein
MALIVPTVFGNGENVTVIVPELFGLIGLGIALETVKEKADVTLPRLPTL